MYGDDMIMKTVNITMSTCVIIRCYHAIST